MGKQILGYDFNVEFKPGKQNMVVDALSRRDTSATSDVNFPFFERWQKVFAGFLLDGKKEKKRN